MEYAGYEILEIKPLWEEKKVYKRPGAKVIAYLPAMVQEVQLVEKGKLVAFTGRGAFWIREGKKPRRIAASPIVYTWRQETVTICSPELQAIFASPSLST